MKKILMTFAAVLCCAMSTPVLTSCSVDDNPTPNPVQDDLAEATILWYGCGGNNVDAAILQNFRTFYQAQAKNFDRVNVVAQYKHRTNRLYMNTTAMILSSNGQIMRLRM